MKLRAKLVADISDPLKANAIEQSQKEGKVFEDTSSGRAKLRYIVGWCVATLRHRKRSAVRQNLYSNNSRDYVNQLYYQASMLDTLI
ncbi:hypothetical protein ACJMK2_013946 [Sinanodonta woodiana]|uniref:Uncharacterized protein n=1 Tax=Sinanodonta woodiana TaxID=1069815 RepID=A0ABD3V205_SINWO